jgi:hypothetical protein
MLSFDFNIRINEYIYGAALLYLVFTLIRPLNYP